MPLTSRLSVVSQRFVTLLNTLIDDEDFYHRPLKAVYYGDQTKIPHTPAVCVEPMQVSRSWPPQPSLMTENTMEITFFVYHARVDSVEVVKLECDQFAEELEAWVNMNHINLADAAGNPLIIHGNTVENEYGYSFKTGTLFHASRILWRGISKTRLTEGV